MEDYRFRLIEIEEEEEENEFEDEEIEDDDDDEVDYDVREREENLIPERIVLPIDFDVFNTGEIEDDDEFDDDDEEDEEDYEEEEEEDEEELFPVVRMLHRDPIEDDYYEDEDVEEEDYVEEDEDEELEELFPAVMTSSRVSNSIFHDSELCEGTSEKSGGEIHGLICPICFEAWTSGGEHQICCLPCGHIYGLSCIKKWLQQRISGKCPQCNKICTFKDVRVLYASQLCATDEELHKRVRSLEAKCAYLEQKASPLTPDELIDQICGNPAAVQRLVTVLAGLYQQPVSP